MTATSSGNSGTDPDFPHAPAGWSQNEAARAAAAEGLEPDESRWEAVRALQDYYSRHDELAINTRDLHDALEEKFHTRGGMKYLYRLFPGGPVTQGCRIAGLEPPAGSADKGFGSVQ
jgi:TusE/DsrC/DsvC family sulfur relay protein